MNDSSVRSDSGGGAPGGSDVAVIGLAGHFPGAGSVDELWRLLRDGRRGIRPLTTDELRAAGVDEATLRDPSYVKVGAPLDGVELFDAGFFGFSPRDAAIMDPQHRHFLEAAWEALETAGHTPARFAGSIGVFGGCGMQAYLIHNLLTNPDLVRSVGMFLLRHTGNDKDFLTTRVSYLLDLTGPSVSIQTACSTSLVAIHMACQSLLAGECDLALAGGVTIEIPHGQGYHFREGEILAPDGHCRAFDARAAGTVFGSGVGVVALRRLADALADGDTIHAVVKGSAVNNDGALKAGYLAPSVEGQARAIAEALAVAGVSPESVGYVEAHGTGTPVGDPIEVAALTQAFGGETGRRGLCRIGSIKPSIGHLDTAAGVASFIKATLALEHGELPASLDFDVPNPEIHIENSPFVVNTALTPWTSAGAPRRAGVNSLGVGGTNAFVVLEEPPAVPRMPRTRPYELLTLSAKTPGALDAMARRLADHLRARPDANLADVAYTLQNGRKAFDRRLIVAARDAADAALALDGADPKRLATGARAGGEPSIAFMFAGGGAQYPGMGRELYATEPAYRAALDDCLALLPGATADELRRRLVRGDGDGEAVGLEAPALGLPALFATQYALARLWQAWGVEPSALIGHSVGEYAAACLAGVLTLEDALGLVVLRGELFETLPAGGMTSVQLAEVDLRPLLGEELSLAAVNATDLCVASGPVEALDRLEHDLEGRGVSHSRLKIAVAAHSRMVEPILDRFEARVAATRLRAPTVPYISTLTGSWIGAEQVMDPAYWRRQLRETVRFADGLRTLLGEPDRLVVEVGPGQALTSLARLHPAAQPERTVVPSLPRAGDGESEVRSVLTALGRLWVAGLDVDWERLHEGHGRRRVPLPTYPFERRRHWIEPGRPVTDASAGPERLGADASARLEPSDAAAAGEPVAERSLVRQASMEDWFYRPVWQMALRDRAEAGERLTWLVLTDGGPLATQLARGIADRGDAAAFVTPGTRYHAAGRAGGDLDYELDPASRADWDRLVADLQARGHVTNRIVHLWSFAPGDTADGADCFKRMQDRGFFSLLHLAQALGDAGIATPLHLTVVTSGLRSVDGEPVAAPERATLDGPCRVIPRELPTLTCQTIDLEPPTTERHAITLAEQLLGELTRPLHEPTVALRDGRRWAELFERASMPSVDGTGRRLRERGVYLLTGGLGGIGLTLAEYLARTVRARLVLVGRSWLPARDDWDGWIASHAASDATRRVIERVRELEGLGAEVQLARADVADPPQVARVVGEAKARFGRLDGVIHAAGVLDDAPLQLKSRADAERVMAPKVRGALALDAALRDEPLDFVLLCASTSAILGQAGQVDYAAANAFLDAFAISKRHPHGARRDGPVWMAVDWGIWQEVGMAARAAGKSERHTDGAGESDVQADGPRAGSEDRASHRARDMVTCAPKYEATDGRDADALPPSGPPVHPLLGVRERDEPDRIVYRARYDPGALWVLDEHRLRQGGVAILPGAAYLELARAALAHRAAGRAVEVRDLILLAPLAIGEGETGRVRITLEREGSDDTYGLVVESVAGNEPGSGPIEHARATVRLLPAADRAGRGASVPPPRPGAGAWASRQDRAIAFGPRWRTVGDFEVRAGVAFARLELPEEFAADLAAFPLHPALVDMATSIGLPLIRGYADANDFYVPLSWARARVYGPLPRTLLSRASLRAGVAAHGLAVFDVAIADERGNVLVEVEGFALTRVDPTRLLRGRCSPTGQATGRAGELPRGRAPGILRDVLPEGIRPTEGADVFARVLAGGYPRVVATSIDLYALLDRVATSAAPARRAADVATDGIARPSSEAPRTEVERRIAALWRELLGLADVGIRDDFFELGGHSLIAVRLLAQVRKAFGVDLALDTLFRASTIAAWAEIVEQQGSGGSGTGPSAAFGQRAVGPGAAYPVRDAAAAEFRNGAANGHAPSGDANGHAPHDDLLAVSHWSPLVEIQAGTTLPPFFCIHGAGGNVVNVRDLARYLGADQPFYGLQARGVDGRLPPLHSIEEMAALYLAEIRTVQPRGPYSLGGYSGGGVIAFEMAHQLLRQGERARVIAFIDTFCPALPSQRGVQGALRNLRDLGPSYARHLPKKGLDVLVRGVKRAQVKLHERRGVPLPHELRYLRMWDTNLAAIGAYRPRPYPGRIALFRAAVGDATHAYDVPDLGWGPFADEGIELHEIPGTHDTLVLEPNVRVLADHLRGYLDRARSADAEA